MAYIGKRKRRAYQRAISGIKAAWYHDEHVRFLTIGSLYKDSKEFKKSFNLFVARIRYHFGKFEYINFKEETVAGCVHAHMLFRGCFMPHAWLLEQWEDITGQSSANVYVKLVRSTPWKVANYMLKYLSKNMLNYGFSQRWIFRGATRAWNLIKKEFMPDLKLCIVKFDAMLAYNEVQVNLQYFGVPVSTWVSGSYV